MPATSQSQIEASPAHFWISSEAVSPSGPEVPTNIIIPEGEVGSLYIWARPETGKKLRSISLNLVAKQAGIDFIDSSIIFYNDAGGGTQRFEYVSDSTSTLPRTSDKSFSEVSNGEADSIKMLQGFTISESSPSAKGIGNVCVGQETGCTIAGDGKPAWLIGTVDYNAIVNGPSSIDIHLQVGGNGIKHETLVPGDYDLNGVVNLEDISHVTSNFNSTVNLWADGNGNGKIDSADYTVWRDNLGAVSDAEPANLTSVRFGADIKDGVDEPIYNGLNDINTTLLPLDDPDATITIVSANALLIVPEPTAIRLVLCLVLYLIAKPHGTRFGK